MSLITRRLEFSKLFFALVACVFSIFILSITFIGYSAARVIEKSVSYDQFSAAGKTLRQAPQKYFVEYANTPELQEKGLSGRSGIATSSVMLFTFKHADMWGIWMKDMKFSIDIIWLDENLSVIHIKEGARPDSYPELYMPAMPAMYVVEASVGFVKSNQIKIGDVFILEPRPNNQEDLIYKKRI